MRTSQLLVTLFSLYVMAGELAVGSAAAQMTQAERLALEAEVAAMDFMDFSVPVLEMREKLTKLMPVRDDVMNDEVLAYTPTETDLYLTLPDGRYENQIFADVTFRENETKQRAAFHEWVKKNNLNLPAGMDTDNLDLRILVNRDFDFQKTYDTMWSYDKDHRERILPILRDFEKKIDQLQNGLFFSMGRDRNKRPVIYLKAKTWIRSGLDTQEILNMIDIVISYVTYNGGLVPGRIELYHTIVDLRDVSWGEMPFSSFARYAMHCRNGYFTRSASISFVNVPKVVQIASMFVYKLVDEFQGAKMYFFSDDFGPKLSEMIGKENLEKPYGGYIPKKNDDFWPPDFEARASKPAKKQKKQDPKAEEL